MKLVDLFKLIKNFYGYKASKIYINSEKNEVIVELYEAFVTKYHIDDNHGEFYAGIVIGNENDVLCGKILGLELPMTLTEKFIFKSLDMVDEYCRLRLPDKYLKVYDNIHNRY